MTPPVSGNGWRIDPAAAGSAIADAKMGISGLDDVATAAQAAIDAASAIAGPKTAAALARLARNPFLSQIQKVRSGVEQAADQTKLALDAYVQGDEEMASHSAEGIGR
ncbi:MULTISPECIES: DUF6507 family protein [Clavibacter]|uniref:DUF6507 family protein n=1 Tax=Clavibacter TaxID=1573 RepID=UPI00104245DE|nr:MULTISPECIES: DUF6507 family protein [Clavibacter]MDA3805159.1 DUF6507 family protein [Clavibacter sp. CT19]